MLIRKRPSDLTEKQTTQKLVKDKEYDEAVHRISTPFYKKKRSAGVSAQEEQVYTEAKNQLWDDYKTWAEGAGLYKEVSKEDELVMAETGLDEILERVNKIRGELGIEPRVIGRG